MVAAGDQIEAADITDLEDLTIRKPMVRLVQASAQSIPDATVTSISFTTEEFDPYNFHDAVTNNTRITPSIAGWYRFTGSYISVALTTPVAFYSTLRKNGGGGLNAPPGNRHTGLGTFPSAPCTALIKMNGSTDYVELTAFQDSAGAANTSISSYATSVLECEFIRQS